MLCHLCGPPKFHVGEPDCVGAPQSVAAGIAGTPSSGWYPFNEPRNRNNDNRTNVAHTDDEYHSSTEGALVITNEGEKPMVSTLKGLGINIAKISRETLYVLQDGTNVELRATESRALQVLSEKEINMEQLSL